MRDYTAIAADAREGSAFSNSSQFEYWANGPRGCYSCRNDGIGTTGDEPFCPILSVSMTGGGVPAEWVTFSDSDHIHGNYTCTEYSPRDSGGGDGSSPAPKPQPEMPGQIDVFEVFADQIVDKASGARAEVAS